MSATILFKRLILRAVLRDACPMVARLISVSDDTELSDLHDVFQQVLGWSGDLGYSFRIHGKEFNSFPRRRLWELLKSQGMQENQQVVFLSDGGDTVRQLQEYLHPTSEHWIDWFHVTMRLTVLQQQAKGLQAERPQFGQEVTKQLESVKH